MATVQSRSFNGHSWARDFLLRSVLDRAPPGITVQQLSLRRLPVRRFGPFGIRFMHYLLP
jgi:hypothetical protein